jgi:hypothetical protein
MHRLWVDPRFQTQFARLGFDSVEAVVRHFAGTQPPPKSVWLKPDTLRPGGGEPLPVFYKQYSFRRPSWKFWRRPSKARREFDNYAVFELLQLPCATRVACGESRDALGRLCRAFIVTRTVPDAVPLPEFVAAHCADRATPARARMRDSLIRQVAGVARRLHAEAFFHHDLVWRNILVTLGADREPTAWPIDCPSGGRVRGRLFQRPRRLKDLASLDKLASQHCTLRERLRFMQFYCAERKLGPTSRRLVRAALDYRRRRWPDDWK